MPIPPVPDDTDTAFDATIDALVSSVFPGTVGDDFILWETRPPKDAKLFRANYSGDEIDGGTQLTLMTYDSTKANGFAFSAPANATATAIAQTARLKAKYE